MVVEGRGMLAACLLVLGVARPEVSRAGVERLPNVDSLDTGLRAMLLTGVVADTLLRPSCGR